MRSEQDMMKLIVNTAEQDPRIRAAYLEGSRADSRAPKDIFQDYDVVYIVGATGPFREDRGWIDRFGERLYMQYPDENPDFPSDVERCYGWLIQFAGGNRLDLHVCTADYALKHLELYRTLVDKDGIMPGQQMDSDEIYWVKKPTEKQFLCACNEFWWCLNNVAKGLWRGELPYVMEMIDMNIRPVLRRVLEWKIGVDHDFAVNPGKSGKYMEKYIPRQIYQRYLETYCEARSEAVWQAVFTMCTLFEEVGAEVGISLGYSYDFVESGNSRKFLERVREQADAGQKMVTV